MMRVDSIARAHRHLYRDGQGSEGNVRDYLQDLCGALSDALLLRGGVTRDCDADAATIQRDHAVSIGLVLNELVTNAAKHAFEGRERGSIHVSWKRHDGGWRLTVADDGVGMPPGKKPVRRDGGLGQRLIEAFAKQAGGTLSTKSDAGGTQVTMDLPDRANPGAARWFGRATTLVHYQSRVGIVRLGEGRSDRGSERRARARARRPHQISARRLAAAGRTSQRR